MSITPIKIIEDAKKLTPQERANVAEALIASLNTKEAPAEKSWLKNVEKRLQELATDERHSVYGI